MLSEIAKAKLQEFENELNPVSPEGGRFKAKVIGYGEMSTVFSFEDEDLKNFAFKRMAVFNNPEEVEKYRKIYGTYNTNLKKLGLNLPEYGSFPVKGKSSKKNKSGKETIVLYLWQKKLNSANIANKILHRVNEKESLKLFEIVLNECYKVFSFNEVNKNKKYGLDAQLSNWVVSNMRNSFPSKPKLTYIDTSTPLMRISGVEQLNTELFLRICPASLVWIVRRFFLDDVVDRYYDFRLVVIDIIANLFKEQKKDLIPPFIEKANEYFSRKFKDISPITFKEVKAYYKEDAFIWRLFLFLRKLERFWKKITLQSYDVILPGRIKR